MSDLFTSDSALGQRRQLVPILFRVLVWSTLFGIVYILRSFFLLIFLTFVFAYIQANGVNRLESRIKNRNVRVVLVALALLAVILAIGAFLVPRVKEQAKIFVDRYPIYLQTLDKSLHKLSSEYPILNDMLLLHFDPDNQNATYTAQEVKKSPSANLLQQLFGFGDANPNSPSRVRDTLNAVRNIGVYLLALGSAFLLSLLFSFLIVLDLPELTRGAKSLKDTKLRPVYMEVAGSIHDFGMVLGRALEAQLVIALLNTTLTAIGVTLMGIGDKLAFISVIVFLCSFIPVAGVFISSLPICLLALQESGVGLMFIAIILITVIHLIEAYILNPKIYGYHLRMNPIVVLMILTMAGKLFHVWGLVLGVPICTYIFGHAIRRKETEVIT